MKVNEFFNFSSSPFLNNHDSMYESKDYREIDKRLEFFNEQSGTALFTGIHGTGKSTIIKYLLDTTNKNIYIRGGDLTSFEFFNQLGRSLEIDTNHCHISKIYEDIVTRSETYKANNKKLVIIIDDIERLPVKTLEGFKLLCDSEISLIIIGHSSFRSRLKDGRLAFLVNDIIINYDCGGLSVSETKEYIKHRLSLVSDNGLNIDDRYFNTIFTYTNGIPQIINKYMSTVLLIAYIRNTKTIDNKLLQLANDEMEI